MNTKDKNTSINIDALLKTYSVKEITNLFSQIDKQIISLHNCSAGDFLQLNNSYKEVYKNSNQISKNIVDILKAFNKDESSSLYKGINIMYEKLNAQFEILDYKILVLADQFEKLSNHIRHLFFPLKNFKQNLISLNYLIANIKVSMSYTNKSWKDQLGDCCIESEKKIGLAKLTVDEIIDSLNQLSKSARKSKISVQEIKNQKDIDLETFLSEIQSTIKTIDTKNEKNKEILPKIKKNIEELSQSNSEIIKKIQYQDIIKQKMEHIQKSHNDLIKELVEFNEPQHKNNHINKKIDCFMRIRDISGVQAAQLLLANKEYQTAIEVITDNFIKIGDNIKNTNENCDKIFMFGKVNFTKMFEKIISYVNKANIYIEDYTRQSILLDKEITEIYKKFGQSEKVIGKFRKEIKGAREILESTNNEVSKVSVNESDMQGANMQFNSLLAETDSNYKKLESLFDALFSLKKNIEGFANKTDSGLLESIDFSDFKNILKSLQLSGTKISKKLDENNVFSKIMIKNIKNSILKIRYYDYFETTIQEIITELNTINFKLNDNKSNKTLSKEQNLEKLKKHYTMQTEHYVHDKVVKGGVIDIDFNINENDEIEFF